MLKRKYKICYSIIIISFLCLMTSCVTTTLETPVPGYKKEKIKNIYNEYYNIAETYYSLENYDKAITYYKLAMNSRPLYWGAYYKLAKSYAIKGSFSEAEEMYSVILKRDPENPTIKSSLAYIYSMNGNVKKAYKIYEELLSTNSENVEILENFIALLFSLEEYDYAKEKIQYLKEYFPDSNNIKTFEAELEKIFPPEEGNEEDIESSELE